MSKQEFAVFLQAMFFWSAISPIVTAYFCLKWRHLVERKISKVIFIGGCVLMLSMGLVKLTASNDFENYSLRAVIVLISFVQGVVSTGLFAWGYVAQKREHSKRIEAENKLKEKSIGETLAYRITQADKAEWIKSLHPKDLKKIVIRYSPILD